MPRVPRLGHAATATTHSMRAPAGDQFRRTAATASVQQAPSALKYQRTGESTPRALKRTQSCLRRKLSPPATPAATDQRGGRFFVTSSRPSQPSWSPLFNEPRRRPSNAVTRTSVILCVIARQGCPDAGIRGVPRDGAAGFPATTIRLQPMYGDSGRRPDRRK